jgi:hypothetical protein
VVRLGTRTASGIRSQNREIKYKKPTPIFTSEDTAGRAHELSAPDQSHWGRSSSVWTRRHASCSSGQPSKGEGGPINPWRVRGALPHGVSRTDFFSWRWRFDYFSRNQRIQTVLRLRSGDKWSHCKHLDGALCSVGPGGNGFAGIYFPSLFESRGVVKTPAFGGRDRGAAPQMSPQNSENFFCSYSTPDLAAGSTEKD